MLVTGYKLREAIRQQELKLSAVVEAFPGSLFRFPEEQSVKMSPHQVLNTFSVTEGNIARLQVAQMRYNLAVTVKVDNESMSLAEAVKRLGGVSRKEKLWRQAVSKKKDRYGFNNDTERDTTKVYAVATVAPEEALKASQEAARVASAFRAAVATGNAVEIELDLHPSLFE